jgi:TRAP-type C4-dicarboxylate transport system permease large subunit
LIFLGVNIVYGYFIIDFNEPVKSIILLAGLLYLIPGILLIVVLAIYSIYQGRSFTFAHNHQDVLPIKAAIWQARYELPLPFLVLGGIYGGFVTASEAAALTAFYVLIIECFFAKDLSITRDVPKIIAESMTLVGAILLILCCALGLTNYLVDEEIPMKILQVMIGLLSHFMIKSRQLTLFNFYTSQEYQILTNNKGIKFNQNILIYFQN